MISTGSDKSGARSSPPAPTDYTSVRPTPKQLVRVDMSRFGSRRLALPDVACPVQFERVPAAVGLHDNIDVYFVVDGSRFRPKSGDWIGLFRCDDEEDRESSDRDKTSCSCIHGTYSFLSFQWAPKRPNIAPGIARRYVQFTADQIDVEPNTNTLYRFLYMTNTDEKVIGCSNRFKVRLVTSVPVPWLQSFKKTTANCESTWVPTTDFVTSLVRSTNHRKSSSSSLSDDCDVTGSNRQSDVSLPRRHLDPVQYPASSRHVVASRPKLSHQRSNQRLSSHLMTSASRAVTRMTSCAKCRSTEALLRAIERRLRLIESAMPRSNCGTLPKEQDNASNLPTFFIGDKTTMNLPSRPFDAPVLVPRHDDVIDIQLADGEWPPRPETEANVSTVVAITLNDRFASPTTSSGSPVPTIASRGKVMTSRDAMATPREPADSISPVEICAVTPSRRSPLPTATMHTTSANPDKDFKPASSRRRAVTGDLGYDSRICDTTPRYQHRPSSWVPTIATQPEVEQTKTTNIKVDLFFDDGMTNSKTRCETCSSSSSSSSICCCCQPMSSAPGCKPIGTHQCGYRCCQRCCSSSQRRRDWCANVDASSCSHRCCRSREQPLDCHGRHANQKDDHATDSRSSSGHSDAFRTYMMHAAVAVPSCLREPTPAAAHLENGEDVCRKWCSRSNSQSSPLKVVHGLCPCASSPRSITATRNGCPCERTDRDQTSPARSDPMDCTPQTVTGWSYGYSCHESTSCQHDEHETNEYSNLSSTHHCARDSVHSTRLRHCPPVPAHSHPTHHCSPGTADRQQYVHQGLPDVTHSSGVRRGVPVNHQRVYGGVTLLISIEPPGSAQEATPEVSIATISNHKHPVDRTPAIIDKTVAEMSALEGVVSTNKPLKVSQLKRQSADASVTTDLTAAPVAYLVSSPSPLSTVALESSSSVPSTLASTLFAAFAKQTAEPKPTSLSPSPWTFGWRGGEETLAKVDEDGARRERRTSSSGTIPKSVVRTYVTTNSTAAKARGSGRLTTKDGVMRSSLIPASDDDLRAMREMLELIERDVDTMAASVNLPTTTLQVPPQGGASVATPALTADVTTGLATTANSTNRRQGPLVDASAFTRHRKSDAIGASSPSPSHVTTTAAKWQSPVKMSTFGRKLMTSAATSATVGATCSGPTSYDIMAFAPPPAICGATAVMTRNGKTLPKKINNISAAVSDGKFATSPDGASGSSVGNILGTVAAPGVQTPAGSGCTAVMATTVTSADSIRTGEDSGSENDECVLDLSVNVTHEQPSQTSSERLTTATATSPSGVNCRTFYSSSIGPLVPYVNRNTAVEMISLLMKQSNVGSSGLPDDPHTSTRDVTVDPPTFAESTSLQLHQHGNQSGNPGGIAAVSYAAVVRDRRSIQNCSEKVPSTIDAFYAETFRPRVHRLGTASSTSDPRNTGIDSSPCTSGSAKVEMISESTRASNYSSTGFDATRVPTTTAAGSSSVTPSESTSVGLPSTVPSASPLLPMSSPVTTTRALTKKSEKTKTKNTRS